MLEFDLLQPTNLSDALTALGQGNPGLRPLAGGTDMIVDLRARRARAGVLVALQNVAELRGIARDQDTLRIGASTTVSQLLTTPLPEGYDALGQAAFWFANPMIRNLATVAGNLASASPAGDLLPPLLALDTRIELVSQSGVRTLFLDEFFLGPRKTARQSDELITRLTIPISPSPNRVASAFYKLGLRQADAISLVSVAVRLERDGDAIREVRIALGAVAPRPIRAVRAEQVLRGQTYSEANLEEAARVAAGECAPIDDLRATAAYRRRMVGVYVRRMLEQAWSKTN